MHMTDIIEPSELTALLAEILDRAALGIDTEDRAERLSLLESRLRNVLLSAVASRLSEKQCKAFDRLADKNPPLPEVQAFLRLHIPTFDALVQQVMSDFRRQHGRSIRGQGDAS